MPHLIYAELKELLDQSEVQIPLGSERIHYKNPDVIYVITDLVIDEKTDSPSVVYQKKGDTLGVKFVRLVSSFLVEVSQKKYRFKRV